MGQKTIRDNLRAEDIAEELLHRTGRVYASKDASLAAGCFLLPQTIETSAGKCLLETEDNVRQVFENVMDYYAKNDVTEIVRTVVKAEFLDDNTVGATHVSRLMLSDGSCFRKPYPTYSILRKTQGGWKLSSSAYAILDSDAHNDALRIQPSRADAISLGSAR